jgi:hypothetical protein
MALVDNSIKERWPAKKMNNNARPLSSHGAHEFDAAGPRAFIKGLMNRRHSDQYASSPLRFGRGVTTY